MSAAEFAEAMEKMHWCDERDRRCTLSRAEMRAVLTEMHRLRAEAVLLAKLASPTPQFFNPLVAMEAAAIRDRILAQEPA